MHLLKSNGVIKLSFSFGFAIRAENWLSPKIIISLVYMLTILNRVPVVIIRKYRLNVEVVIKSFSL